MAADPAELAAALIRHLAYEHRQYRLRWQGTKIPRGAKVGEVPIIWTQNGLVIGEGDVDLGLYERTYEFAGANNDQHEILVSTSKGHVYDPAGEPCPIVTEKGDVYPQTSTGQPPPRERSIDLS